MKKILITTTFIASVLFANAQDTVRTTVKNVEFKTVQTEKSKTTVAVYEGKTYTIQGSVNAYMKQVRNFGDCRVLIIGSKMIIL